MDYQLTEEQRAIGDLARQIAEKKIKPVREHYDQVEKFPLEVVEEFKKADLFGTYLPAEYGGLGGGAFELVLTVEELSKACGGIALCVATSALCAIPILLFGTPEQRKKWIPDLASGKKLGAFTITEPGAGSDATATKCTAVKQGDFYVLNGVKNFCSTGEVADLYCLFASTNPARGARGITAFIVEKGTPGFTFGKKETKMGIRASPTYELHFEDCKVPAANVLKGEGYGLFVAQGTFDQSRPGVAAQALGMAQGALDETMAYIRIRKQFGQAVSSFQAIQHMLADAFTQVEAGRSLLYNVSRGMDKDLAPAIAAAIANNTIVFDEMAKLDLRRWTRESAMVKLFCSDVAMKVTTDCVQMCGGIGYMRDFPVEKFMRDAKITQIYEGTNQVQRNEIAMHTIKEYASKGRLQAVAA